MDDEPSCSSQQRKDNIAPPPEKSIIESNSKSLYEMGFRNSIPNWKEAQKCHKKNAHVDLSNLFKYDSPGDIEIKIGKSVFKCQKLILKTYSNYFKKHPNLSSLDLSDKDISPGAFGILYKWMIDPRINIECEELMEVIKAATYFDVPALINLCWNIFSNEKYFCEDLAFMVYFQARLFDFPELKNSMLRRVRKFYTHLISTLEFVLLTAEELNNIISNDFIEVNMESEVFFSIVHWVNYDWETRHVSLVMLMRSIRFTTMPVTFMLYLLNDDHCDELKQVVEHDEVKKIIRKSLEFCIVKESCHISELPALLAKLGLGYKPRNWIFDPQCSYHHRSDCQKKEVVTYGEFLTHIEIVQKQPPNYWQTFIPADDAKAQCCIEIQRSNSDNKISQKSQQRRKNERPSSIPDKTQQHGTRNCLSINSEKIQQRDTSECLPSTTDETQQRDTSKCLPSISEKTQQRHNSERLPSISEKTQYRGTSECLPSTSEKTQQRGTSKCLSSISKKTQQYHTSECLSSILEKVKISESSECLSSISQNSSNRLTSSSLVTDDSYLESCDSSFKSSDGRSLQ
ncbi:kelch-like protein 12 [Teleopsis dalmanni]|uniref:kelch-like protein 12 n=1 Tax=Teleopsis dalmanni TaxID=139649 RepID=UPI0018CD4BBF|nr:kelch-like protein 12 [Teleopsis dalmanni]